MTGACQIPERDAESSAQASHSETPGKPLVALWSAPLLDRRAVRMGLWIVLAALCLVRAYTGLSGVQVCSHDAFGALDGAWRVLHGQKPHAGFYTPLGPLIYLLTALGLVISRGGAEGFGYSQAIAGMLLAFWTFALARRRLGHLAAILMCLAVVLLAVNPTSVGEPPTNTSCMAYNRYGYALLALLILESLDPADGPDRKTRCSELWFGASTGAALALLLFLKISYFLGGGALLLALFPCRRQTRDRWIGLFSGFACIFLVFWAYLDFRLLPMWTDLRMVSGAKSPRMSWFIVENLYLTVIFYFGYLLAACLYLSKAGARSSLRMARIAAPAICVAGIFLLTTNFQFYDLPLNALMIVLVLERICRHPAVPGMRPWKPAGLLLCGGFFVAGSLIYGALGLGFAVYGKQTWAREEHSAFQTPSLAGFQSFEKDYVDLVNDGLALVSQHRRVDDTIMSLDFSNPFSYGLGMRPAPGGSTVLDYPGNFSDAHHPAPERLFGQASLVIVPVKPTQIALTASVPRVYGPYLAGHFSLVAHSQGWRLYRHNPEPVADHAF